MASLVAFSSALEPRFILLSAILAHKQRDGSCQVFKLINLVIGKGGSQLVVLPPAFDFFQKHSQNDGTVNASNRYLRHLAICADAEDVGLFRT